ncbi:MAG: DUF4197 domain-containing protein [Gammaproteobacteria bacterium]
MGNVGKVVVAIALASIAAGATAQGVDLLEQGRQLLRGTGTASSASPAARGLSSGEIGNGLREALRVGTGNVVSRLGRSGGFTNDPAVHIPLPKGLKTARALLDRIGQGAMLDDLELKMNRAAEAAAPQARQLFVDAISQMTIDDVMAIYNGAPDSATRYFQSKMSAPLAERMTPVVERSLADTGAVRAFDGVMSKYQSIPLAPAVKTNLTKHVVNKGMDGIFHYLGQEEAAIRQNPVKQTTSLLRRVFGNG